MRITPMTVGGLLGQCLLLLAVSVFVPLSTGGWVAGVAVAAVAVTWLDRGLRADGRTAARPADRVTLTRALLAGAVTALVVASATAPVPRAAIVTVAVVALLLDGVDGQVARRTGTVSALGARFDGEVDAYLMLVLCVPVAATYGTWVLAIGAARYLFLVAGYVWPWLAAPLPYRYWRKVVAATQGIVLTVAVADVVPAAIAVPALVLALALLGESFGRDVLWLWLHRRPAVLRLPDDVAAVRSVGRPAESS